MEPPKPNIAVHDQTMQALIDWFKEQDNQEMDEYATWLFRACTHAPTERARNTARLACAMISEICVKIEERKQCEDT